MLVYQNVFRPGLYQLLRLRRASTCQLHQAPSSLPTIGRTKPSRLKVHMWVQNKNNKNNGTPKSSILIGFSIINHPFWGTMIFGNTHLGKLLYFLNLNVSGILGRFPDKNHHLGWPTGGKGRYNLPSTMYVMKRNPSRKNQRLFQKDTILGCSLIISIPWQYMAIHFNPSMDW